MLNISDTTEAVEPTAASEFLPSCLPMIMVSVRVYACWNASPRSTGSAKPIISFIGFPEVSSFILSPVLCLYNISYELESQHSGDTYYTAYYVQLCAVLFPDNTDEKQHRKYHRLYERIIRHALLRYDVFKNQPYHVWNFGKPHDEDAFRLLPAKAYRVNRRSKSGGEDNQREKQREARRNAVLSKRDYQPVSELAQQVPRQRKRYLRVIYSPSGLVGAGYHEQSRRSHGDEPELPGSDCAERRASKYQVSSVGKEHGQPQPRFQLERGHFLQHHRRKLEFQKFRRRHQKYREVRREAPVEIPTVERQVCEHEKRGGGRHYERQRTAVHFQLRDRVLIAQRAYRVARDNGEHKKHVIPPLSHSIGSHSGAAFRYQSRRAAGRVR